MKSITLPKTAEINPLEVLATVAMSGGTQGMTIADMRQRLKIADAVDAAKKANAPCVELEDAEHGLLVRLLDVHPFAIAHKDLVAIADAVREAKDAAVIKSPKSTE